MPTLTLMPGGEAPSTPSQYTPDSPNWILVIVHDQEIAIESWCGRYFEWLDNRGDDWAELLNDADCSELANGLYVVEGHAITHPATANEGRETEWHFDRIRSLTLAEWQRYRGGEEIWDSTHFDSKFVEHAIDETTSEMQALLDAGKAWLAWRRDIEVDLSEAEAKLAQTLLTLMDESDDGLPNISG